MAVWVEGAGDRRRVKGLRLERLEVCWERCSLTISDRLSHTMTYCVRFLRQLDLFPQLHQRF